MADQDVAREAEERRRRQRTDGLAGAGAGASLASRLGGGPRGPPAAGAGPGAPPASRSAGWMAEMRRRPDPIEDLRRGRTGPHPSEAPPPGPIRGGSGRFGEGPPPLSRRELAGGAAPG
eukprot:227367-Prorocentrum_minimum.AAC.1